MSRVAPWWAKMALKIVLSRIPLSYSHFSKVGLFRHGRMDDPEYALQVFRRHFDRASFAAKRSGFVALELGPGDSLLSAVIARDHGATKCYLVDSGRYAAEDPAAYKASMKVLRSAAGLDPGAAEDFASLNELLEQTGGVYLTNGLDSLRAIPDSSVDFVWSHAVLEHIRLAEFDETMQELHRLMRPTGIASHRIDLKDHLGGSLNNLRLPKRIWEADWMARSGFYTNRLRYTDMLERLESLGAGVEVVHVDEWERPPVPRTSLAPEFEGYTDDVLRVSGFDVLLTKPVNSH